MSECELKDVSSTPDVNERREARRRKILENSKMRLEKLYGRNPPERKNKEDANDSQTFSDPEMETEQMFVGINSYQSQSQVKKQDFHQNPVDSPEMMQYLLGSNALPSEKKSSNIHQKPIYTPQSEDYLLGANTFQTEKNCPNVNQNPVLSPDFGNFLLGANAFQSEGEGPSMHQIPVDDKQQCITAKILKTKFHLVILSLFTYWCIVFGDKYFSSYSIFLPLLIWELTETIIIRPKENNVSEAVLNLVLMMVGVPINFIRPLLKITLTLNKIFKDVGLFIFSFVICHLIYMQFESEGTEHEINIVKQDYTV